MKIVADGGVAERPCVRLQNNIMRSDSEYIRVRIPSPPLKNILFHAHFDG